ncbi:type 1 glutamine amidotransferase domain-containing protein [Pseudohongiella sp.]|uniref:DJ-1/PfpI domain-containing protein n=1 Tax=marine sediment metagenome TaxID=412755 RepID=A0A0F9WHA3_9ZZZZ|nr:type 1 glutamine amidotransferase domain-containing protein [Pseudohongiella sp.]HDZ08471.1 type 1 glutamine amidotransferase [Pseudohongiella sp.]
MDTQLANKHVAILVADGFEQVEFQKPKDALREAGAKVTVVSLKPGEVQGMHHDKTGDRFAVHLTAVRAKSKDYDALMLPGGVMNPDALRNDESAVAFARDFVREAKPIFAICHGPQVLITADAVKGKTMTSFESVKTDLENAGAHWVDKPVVVDDGLVTSRKPDDIPQFIDKMLEELAEGRH